MVLDFTDKVRGEHRFAALKSASDAQIRDLAWAIDQILSRILVEPRFSKEPKSPDELDPGRLSPEDFLFLVGWLCDNVSKAKTQVSPRHWHARGGRRRKKGANGI
ncbi:MAG: hypothetical protein ABSH05_17720 [Bryobacteraceae bacterium]